MIRICKACMDDAETVMKKHPSMTFRADEYGHLYPDIAACRWENLPCTLKGCPAHSKEMDEKCPETETCIATGCNEPPKFEIRVNHFGVHEWFPFCEDHLNGARDALTDFIHGTDMKTNESNPEVNRSDSE